MPGQIHLDSLPVRVCALDIETTGLGSRSRIVEIAVVQRRGADLESWSTLVDPEAPIPAAVARLHGINGAMVAGAVGPSVALLAASSRIDAPIVAHHAGFDLAVLSREMARVGHPWSIRSAICTLALAKRVMPSLCSWSLGDVAHELGVEHHQSHRARSDAVTTVLVYEALRRVVAENRRF